MEIFIDLILVAIVLAGIVIGYKRGFVQTVAKPVKVVAVWFFAIQCCSFFANTFVAPLVREPITKKFTEFLEEKCGGLTASNAAEELPSLLKLAAKIFDINVEEVTAGAGNALVERLAETFSAPVVSIFSVVISFIVLMILFSVVFALAFRLLDGLFNTRPLAWVNRLLGVVFALALALILAWGFALLAGAIFKSLENESGAVYQFFRSYNPVDILFGF